MCPATCQSKFQLKIKNKKKFNRANSLPSMQQKKNADPWFTTRTENFNLQKTQIKNYKNKK
jgi:hypothetical protein